MGIDGIPFLAGSPEELKVLQKHIRPEYEKIAARNNQTILYIVPWPNQYLHLKVKAETVDALKGIKIRIADKNAQEMWATVGMAAVRDPMGRDHPGAVVGRGVGRVDLGGVGRRRQVLGVPEVLPRDQPSMVVGDRQRSTTTPGRRSSRSIRRRSSSSPGSSSPNSR